MDDLFTNYVNRLARMTLPETYQTQVQNIQPSAKYQRSADGEVEPLSFPGYSVITPPWRDDPNNKAPYSLLENFQQTVVQEIPAGVFAPVPPASFHMTIADLIWADQYRHAADTPGFEADLRDRIQQSFQIYQSKYDRSLAPLEWELMGLIVMPRAIAIGLAPKTEQTYERILTLRRTLYQNSDLIALGVEQQYHLTGHITLGYFTDLANTVDRQAFYQACISLSHHWIEHVNAKPLQVVRAELRKFDDMTRYIREDDWPVVML
ncbi:MAG: DUF1868 domain-containing protein [Synechococcales bacterium]|nr:DUF1868 domain-containing protein [Synechococcales bacterium]